MHRPGTYPFCALIGGNGWGLRSDRMPPASCASQRTAIEEDNMPALHEYAEIRPSLRNGDIVLMGGTSIFSRIIRRMTGSRWSHVGMVVRIDALDTVLLWESTTSGHEEDVQTGAIKRGVQLVPLSKRVTDHTGNLAFRRLSRELTGAELGKLNAFRHSVKDKGYDFDGLELLRAALDTGLFWRNREDLSAYFCSELIAETYQALGNPRRRQALERIHARRIFPARRAQRRLARRCRTRRRDRREVGSGLAPHRGAGDGSSPVHRRTSRLRSPAPPWRTLS